MKNKIKFIQSDEGILIKENQNYRTPLIVDSESEIFKNLREVVKYFFPEPFEFDYSRANLRKETIAGLEGVRDIYDFGASKDMARRKLTKKMVDKFSGDLIDSLDRC